MEILELILNNFGEVIAAAIVTLVTWGAAKWRAYVDEKEKTSKTFRYINKVDDFALDFLLAYVEGGNAELKKRFADGELTAEDLAAIKVEALRNGKSKLGSKIGDIMKRFGFDESGIENWILDKFLSKIPAVREIIKGKDSEVKNG